MKRLRVIALFDGRPGHEKQTLGIIKALEVRTDLELIKINLTKLTILKSVALTLRLLFTRKGLEHDLVLGGDLLIGTGRTTHLNLLLYKRKYGIPAVTCMNPASYLRPFFDLCFVPEHDGVTPSENLFLTVGAPNCSVEKHLHKGSIGLILLGGVDVKSHHWDNDKISKMVKNIIDKETNIQWTISSSPRTPVETIEMMVRIGKDHTNCQFFDYKDTAKGWVEKKYDESSVVWVTTDSISMLFEALSAGCKVGILPVAWKGRRNKFKINEDVLLREKLVVSYGDWETGTSTWSSSSRLKEAQRCADRILQIWWPENLR